MNAIIRFLLKNSNVLVFILLEFIAFSIILNSDSFQSTIFAEQSTSLSTAVNKRIDYVTTTFSLRKENERINTENAFLRSQIQNLQEQHTAILENSEAHSFIPSSLSYIPAQIVHNSIYQFKNYIILNKGSYDGIQEDMGVICEQGVVGVVDHVSKHYATVIPLLHPEQRTSVKIKKNNQLGSLIWNGQDYQTADLEEIPHHISPQIGDTIVTSGFSSIYPANWIVGIIQEVDKNENRQFCKIQVKLNVNFAQLTHAYVIQFKYKNELNQLNLDLNDEK